MTERLDRKPSLLLPCFLGFHEEGSPPPQTCNPRPESRNLARRWGIPRKDLHTQKKGGGRGKHADHAAESQSSGLRRFRISQARKTRAPEQSLIDPPFLRRLAAGRRNTPTPAPRSNSPGLQRWKETNADEQILTANKTAPPSSQDGKGPMEI